MTDAIFPDEPLDPEFEDAVNDALATVWAADLDRELAALLGGDQ